MPEQHRVEDSAAQIVPKCGTRDLGKYPVVDSVGWIKRLLPLGVTTIQLRIKEGSSEQIEQHIFDAVQYCASRNTRLFINDHWALAIKHGAYGVHLGREDIETAGLQAIADAHLRLGISSHCWSKVARALTIKPSYLTLGPIYATDVVRPRVLKQTGVGSVAMISTITQAPDYVNVTRDLLALWAA